MTPPLHEMGIPAYFMAPRRGTFRGLELQELDEQVPESYAKS
jgi:hypothetical protein